MVVHVDVKTCMPQEKGIMSQTTYRWWRDPSRIVRRFYMRMFLPMLLVAVLSTTAGLLKLPHIWPIGDAMPAVMIGMAVVIILWLFPIVWWEKRLVKKLRAADYKLCPHCRYDVTGHESLFNCPECGKACDIGKIQAAWRSFRPVVSGGIFIRKSIGDTDPETQGER